MVDQVQKSSSSAQPANNFKYAYDQFRNNYPLINDKNNNRHVIDKTNKAINQDEVIEGENNNKTNVLELRGTRSDYIFEEEYKNGNSTGRIKMTSNKTGTTAYLKNIQYVRFMQKGSDAYGTNPSLDDKQSFYLKSTKNNNPPNLAATIDTTPDNKDFKIPSQSEYKNGAASQAKITHQGTDGANIIRGRWMTDDVIEAKKGDDIILGNGGDDKIDGGEGNDIAVFNCKAEDAKITKNSNGTYTIQYTIKDRDGKAISKTTSQATLKDIERLRFIDGVHTIDPNKAYSDNKINLDTKNSNGATYVPGLNEQDRTSFENENTGAN